MTRHQTLVFYKPYGVLSRFTPDGSRYRTLAEFGFAANVWPVGRLDADSEGLLILSSDKTLVDQLLNPKFAHARSYWAEVERIPDEAALAALRAGVTLDGQRTLPAQAGLLRDIPTLPARDPPVRFRKHVPTAWLELSLIEGKNRQVRRMTAAVGFPTLRLLRVRIGSVDLVGLQPGQWRVLTPDEVLGLFKRADAVA